MPNAQVVTTAESFDLKSLDEGFVKLKRMSYGESVQRRSMMRLSFETGSNSSSGSKNDFRGEMAMASVEIQFFEFEACVVDHNLTDNSENKMDFHRISTLNILDPKVGQEIEQLISKMNDFDADDGEDEGPIGGNSDDGA